jgi:hypothetical protein
MNNSNESQTFALTVTEGLTVKLSPETGKLVRTVVNDSGSIRVCFVPISAKSGVSLKSLGYKGQAAKAVLRKAKREIGAAIVGAMATAVASGKLDWRSASLTKTGTIGVFFTQGGEVDTAALTEAEERAAKAEAEVAALKAQLAAASAK